MPKKLKGGLAFLLLLLVPWLFFATIPDIIDPPRPDMGTAPVPIANYDPIPADAPIQLQYEAMDLDVVDRWVHTVHPDSLIDLEMLQRINDVSRAKNVSLGLMLGIINAEHSLLSMGAMLNSGGMRQVQNALINPFSYGWTDENTVPLIGVSRSALGAASIVASAVKSWMAAGWDYTKYGEFMSYLSQWYVKGPNAIVMASAYIPWAQNVTWVQSSLSKFAAQPENQRAWQKSIQANLAAGQAVFGQSSIPKQVIAAIPQVLHVTYKAVSDAIQAGGSSMISLLQIQDQPTLQIITKGIAGLAIVGASIAIIMELLAGAGLAAVAL